MSVSVQFVLFLEERAVDAPLVVGGHVLEPGLVVAHDVLVLEARDRLHLAQQTLALLDLRAVRPHAHPLHRVVPLVDPVARLEHQAEPARPEHLHVLEVLEVPAHPYEHIHTKRS